MRAAIESAPLPDDMPDMTSVVDTTIPGPAGSLAVRTTARRPIPRNRPWCTSTAADWLWAPTIPSSRWPAHWRRRRLPLSWPSIPVSARASAAGTVRRRLHSNRVCGAQCWRSRARRQPTCGRRRQRRRIAGSRIALAARDRDGPASMAQVLLYPGLDRDMSAPSIAELADAPLLTRRHRLPARLPWRCRAVPGTVPGPGLRRRPVRPTAGDPSHRGLRPDPRLG